MAAWSPKPGKFAIGPGGHADGPVHSDDATREFGVEYDSLDAAQRAADSARIHNRVLQFSREHGRAMQPVPPPLRHYVIIDWKGHAHAVRYEWLLVGGVPMTETAAEELAAAINRGEFEL